MDMYGWDDLEDDLLYVQQWQLRIRAQAAVLTEFANCKLMCPLAYSKTLDIGDIKVGDEVPFYKVPQKKSSLSWRGPAMIWDPDELGMVLNFQLPSVRVARNCVHRKVEEKDLPQCPPAGDRPLLPVWDVDSWELEPSHDGQLSDTGQPEAKAVVVLLDWDTVITDLPKESSRVESSDGGAFHSRQDEPVPMSVDSVDRLPIHREYSKSGLGRVVDWALRSHLDGGGSES